MANVATNKTKRIFKKTIALILVCVMVFNLFPNVVIGIKDISNNEIFEETIAEISTKEEVNIIGEDVEKRKLNEKHFLLDDGTMLLAMYPENIHYEKDGKLEDIDNTLIEINGVYENKANSFKTTFEKTTKTDKLAKIDMNGFEIKWALEDAVIDETKKINLVEARITEKKDKAISQNLKEEKTVLNKLNSRIEYKNIIKNINLQYDIISDGVKESIIINNKESIQDNFTFIFDVGTLTAELTKENEIIIYDKIKQNIKYIIEAPYMFDNASEYSNDIKVELEEAEDSKTNKKYRIIITPDKEWLEDQKRVYPITIDPTISTNRDYQYIEDTYIFEGDTTYPTRGDAHIIRIGNSKWLGANGNPNGSGNPGRGLIKFDLPELTSGDQVIYAGLSIYNYNKTSEWAPPTRQIQFDVHRMTANWDEDGAYWNNLNNSYDSKIEDYIIYQYNSNTPNTCYEQCFNITSIAKDWYTTGNNYGLMIKEHEEIKGYTSESDMYFVSKNTNASAYYDARPQVTIVYRNQTGLEEYLSYHTQSAGRAGTVYTNDYNGNLILQFEDVTTPGTRLPVTINHVYNTNYREIQHGIGLGFRLNLTQAIALYTINNIEYAKYIDEDGTAHYFEKQGTTNVYKDEDGLGLFLILENNVFTMKDKQGNESKFEKKETAPHWQLKQIKDTNGNTIVLEFDPNVTQNYLITKVTDGAGSEINLLYENGRLSTIVDTAGRITSYSYNGNGSLIGVTYPDGTQSIYAYDNDYKLKTITNIDNTKLEYEYYPETTTRIKSIKEYSSSNELGNTLNITYGNNATTFTDNEGYSQTITFNNWGNQVSIGDFGKEGNNVNDAYGKSYKYGTDENNTNKLLLESNLVSVGDMANNMLQNPKFDNDTEGWSQYSTNTSDQILTVEGNKVFCFSGEHDKLKYIYQEFNQTGNKGDVFSFYGWAKNNGVQNSDDNTTRSARIMVRLTNNNGELQDVSALAVAGSNRMAIFIRKSCCKF